MFRPQIARACAQAQGDDLVRLLRVIEPLPRTCSYEDAMQMVMEERQRGRATNMSTADMYRSLQLAQFANRIRIIDRTLYFAIVILPSAGEWQRVACDSHMTVNMTAAQRKRVALTVKQIFLRSPYGVSYVTRV